MYQILQTAYGLGLEMVRTSIAQKQGKSEFLDGFVPVYGGCEKNKQTPKVILKLDNVALLLRIQFLY